MARYSEEIIEQVRQNNDVVDVISQYVHLLEKEETILDYVHFIMKNLHHFQYHQTGKYFTVLGVELEEMYIHF